MQNSELFRRGIVLPLDDTAEEGLRSNDVSGTMKVQFLEIADDQQFEALWDLGLFQEINARCATLIDDYEEQIVEARLAKGMIAAVDAVARDVATGHSDVCEFLDSLRDMARQASRSSRPLLFVL